MRKRIIAAALAAAMMLAMPISAMATTKPNEWSAPVELEETNATQVQPINIKESHSHLETKYEYGKTRYYVFYAVLVENPNPDWAVDFVSLNVTVYGEDGSVLKTDSETLDWVGEGDSYWFGDYIAFDSDGIKRQELSIRQAQRIGTCTKQALQIRLFVLANLPLQMFQNVAPAMICDSLDRLRTTASSQAMPSRSLSFTR